MMNLGKVVIPSMRISRNLASPLGSSSSIRPYSNQIHPGYTKIKEKYKHFQEPNGIPIHLKGGPMDRFWYYSTIVGCAVGMIMCGEYYYSAAVPKK